MPDDHSPSIDLRRRSVGGIPVGWFVYGILALWITHPLATSCVGSIPTLPGRSETVPLFNLWTIWWNADRLANGYRDYWRAPIFFPASDAFAFSEPQPLTAVLAPLIWATGSRAVAYNVFLWVSLVLNGVAAERLLRRLGIGRWPGFLGGGVMCTLPFVLWQLDVLQLIPIWGMLWSWNELFRLASQRSTGQGVRFGAATGIASLLCMNLGLFHLMLIAPVALGLLWRAPQRSMLVPLGVACLVTSSLIAPLAIGMHRAARQHQFERGADLVRTLSARPGDYLFRPSTAFSSSPAPATSTEMPLNPGWLRLAAATAGLAWGIRRKRFRTSVLVFLTVALLAFLGSLGPNLRLGAWEPYWTLQQIVPGLSGIRSPFRFACIVQLMVVLLAGVGLHGLWTILRCLTSRPAARIAIGALGGLMVLEIPPEPIRLVAMPSGNSKTDWIEFVRTRTPPGKGIVCLPLSPGDQVDDFAETTRWMYLGTFHGRPMLNGYSGFFPAEEFSRREILRDHFPDDLSLQLLAGLDVEYVVMKRPHEAFRDAGEALPVAFEASDGSTIIYRVPPAETRAGRGP